MKVNETDRNINNLSNNFKLKVIDFLKEVGKTIFVTEGFRSDERQAYLFAKGRTTPGNKVTWVKHSNHQDGNAIDIAFYGKELYPSNIEKWKDIGSIAKKYGIDWGYDLWKSDKPHFQDNGKQYILKKENMEIEQFGKIIIRNKLTYPKSIYGIPVRLGKTNSKTLLGLAKVKGYLPGCTKDEIVIFENTFKRGQDFLYKVLMHEFSHFIYHRYLNTKEDDETMFNDGQSFWHGLSIYIDSYISKYASTQPPEDFAELIGFSYYISNNIDLPSKYLFDDPVKFKYEIAIKLYLSGLKKHLNILKK